MTPQRLAGLVLMFTSLMTSAWIPAAQAAGSWQTYLRMYSCTDLIALRDTVWIATGEAGLLRYLRSQDRFESYTREPAGLANNSLTALAYDRSGRLWVGTPGKGVSRLAKDLTTWDLVNAFDGLPSDSITVLEADGDTMWIGTTRGIALWNGREIAGAVPDLGTPSPFSSNDVKGIVVLGDTLFVAVSDGIYLSRLSTSLATWTQVNAGLFGLNVGGLASDGKDVFAVANTATHRWNRITGQWELASGNGSVKKLRDHFGHVLSLSSLGVYEWTTNQFLPISGSPASDNSNGGGTEMAVDPSNKAFASQGGLLWEQASPTWTKRRPPGPVGNNVQNILAVGGKVYLATYDEGMDRLDANGWRNWTPASAGGALQDTTFVSALFGFALLRDRSGRIWVGSWDSAIETFDDSVSPPLFTHKFVPTGPGDDAARAHTYGWASEVDATGYVYIGGDTNDRGTREPIGIDVYDPAGNYHANWKTTNAGLADNQVRALAFDKYGVLWAGFPIGGVRYANLNGNTARDTIPRFVPIASTSTLEIFGLAAYGDSMWVLTTRNLLRFRTVNQSLVSTLEIPAGPAARGAVRPIDVGPDGSVWLGTLEGIRHYKRGGGTEDFRIDNSPLANNEVRAISVDKQTGVVWVGTAGGTNRFDPSYVVPVPPQLSRLNFSVYPNPAWLTGAGIELRIQGNTTSYSGELHDITGRMVRRFTAGANGRVIWDGRDDDGALVPAGVYFVHARGGGRESTARVVVLR
ncbi:MAG: two-component regulator propeller domain-containing protein [Candidatus Eisenbacteria bacterium]